MNKHEALDLLMLLSALESWSFSEKHRLPDYLHESLTESVEVLRREILEIPE